MDPALTQGEATRATIADGRMRGSNQSGLRAHNERAVLSLIRRHGVMAKADIARRTGLSPQTASVIMRALEGEGLVLRDEPRRGRVGQPSIPMRLNPGGAFALGLKIGRRSADLVLMDFVGAIRSHRRITYPYPRLGQVLDFARQSAREIEGAMSGEEKGRLCGLGVAMPDEIWNWGEEIGAPPGVMSEWQAADVMEEIAAVTGHAVHRANDATAACAAENVFGSTGCLDYVYVFVGAFVGGGIVIDGDLVTGRTGNAGALGSMPVPKPGGGTDQLINSASIHVLEKMAREEDGRDISAIWLRESAWDELGPVLDRWIETAASGLAHATVAAASIYDFEAAVIDGSFPDSVRTRLVAATAAALKTLRVEGLTPPIVRAGTIGASAREIGSASLPFFARFLLDHRVLYTESA
ncbi:MULTISPECIES: ROK family transcriptional regulator [unclassified Aureimonas]|uniref:ROK family transcriptional regulator n=1 Tax=unclassified Aureimonas TaxID=2615206 RepID=UPI0006F9C293|nr:MULTISPECIES: ROK family transcriptional regulator [unclassified Aureimonas]KQT64443.1 ROK family transcriptional regulator [Aureimonas sp. Leaf427]KQT81631.1 ROK family transcriptional regulator [Aureimonas sp. Leaf460]